MQQRQWWAESAPSGWNRVKLSENLGATAVAPVAPVDTSLRVHMLGTSVDILLDSTRSTEILS